MSELGRRQGQEVCIETKKSPGIVFCFIAEYLRVSNGQLRGCGTLNVTSGRSKTFQGARYEKFSLSDFYHLLHLKNGWWFCNGTSFVGCVRLKTIQRSWFDILILCSIDLVLLQSVMEDQKLSNDAVTDDYLLFSRISFVSREKNTVQG